MKLNLEVLENMEIVTCIPLQCELQIVGKVHFSPRKGIVDLWFIVNLNAILIKEQLTKLILNKMKLKLDTDFLHMMYSKTEYKIYSPLRYQLMERDNTANIIHVKFFKHFEDLIRRDCPDPTHNYDPFNVERK